MTKSTRKKMAEIALIVIAVLIYISGIVVGANADFFLEGMK